MNILIDNIREQCFLDSPESRENIAAAIKHLMDYYDDMKEISDNLQDILNTGVKFNCSLRVFMNKSNCLSEYYVPQMANCITEFNAVLKGFETKFSEFLQSLVSNRRKIVIPIVQNKESISALYKEYNEANTILINQLFKSASVNFKKENDCIEADKNCRLAYDRFHHASSALIDGIYSFISVEQANKFVDCLWSAFGLLINNKERKVYLEDQIKGEVISNNYEMSGYLFKCNSKKSSWPVGNRWQRRWFIVDGLKLIFCKKSGWQKGKGGHVLCEDLRLAHAKHAVESSDGRRWCIELTWCDPTNAKGVRPQITLQAHSDEETNRWMKILNGVMKRELGSLNRNNSVSFPIEPSCNSSGPAYTVLRESRNSVVSMMDTRKLPEPCPRALPANHYSTMSHHVASCPRPNMTARIMDIPGNALCAECGAPNPRWASVSLGITLCPECGGVHRSLGVHISKVRSLVLDNWEPESIAVMYLLGNQITNSIYEDKVDPDSPQRPDPNSSSKLRQHWVQQKYRDKSFILSKPNQQLLENVAGDLQVCIKKNDDEDNNEMCWNMTELIVHGLRSRNLSLLSLALAVGVDLNKELTFTQDAADDLKLDIDEGESIRCYYPLHLAVKFGFVPAVEFLLLNGAMIDQPTSNGYTSLHIACKIQDVSCVYLLLKRGAKQDKLTNSSKSPLNIAIETANANTVTLLRLQTLNDSTKEANLGSTGDETVNDVFSDFSERAYQQLTNWLSTAKLNHSLHSLQFSSSSIADNEIQKTNPVTNENSNLSVPTNKISDATESKANQIKSDPIKKSVSSSILSSSSDSSFASLNVTGLSISCHTDNEQK